MLAQQVKTSYPLILPASVGFIRHPKRAEDVRQIPAVVLEGNLLFGLTPNAHDGGIQPNDDTWSKLLLEGATIQEMFGYGKCQGETTWRA